MTELLFSFNERNYRDCEQGFRGSNNQEYYLGEYSIDADTVVDVRADKKAVGPYSLVRVKARSRQFFRRSWAHIREDATDVMVLWFVKRGCLAVSHQSGQSVAEAGDFALTRSMTPFAMDCVPDHESQHEVFHLIVPTHLFRQFLSHDINTGFSLPARGRQWVLAERLLCDVYDGGDELSEAAERVLVESALGLIADLLEGCSDGQARQSLSEQRLQEVLRYIEVRLSDPKLSTAMVAEACGISTRYLSHLLKQSGTSFSTLVWEQRLKTASRWLATTEPGDISIAEIAFRVGFKSPAHFSRLFKRVYGKGPREYRIASRKALEKQHQEMFEASVSGTLQ